MSHAAAVTVFSVTNLGLRARACKRDIVSHVLPYILYVLRLILALSLEMKFQSPVKTDLARLSWSPKQYWPSGAPRDCNF